jgi:hypothetical protein
MSGIQQIDESLIETVVSDLGLKSEADETGGKNKQPVF